MYILDTENNNLKKAQVCSFKELNLEERKNLQEWIAKEPASLGEDLLIIQKEFDGFADTKERLDLLALDKQGCLVIIENKLDDSGRDVTWQAIKYASYCSSLNKTEIIQMFQKYLGSSANAADVISEFMDDTPIEELDLNPDNTQRIFFVAANFRKEVTSSVLWLSNFGIRIKCFRVTPYKYGDRVLIDFDQIIPIKDTEEYTIKMASKKQEAAQASDASSARRKNRQEFWHRFIEYNKQVGGPFSTSNGTHDSWLGKSVGVSGINCNVIINNNNVRTEIYMNFGDKDKNKEVYDFFFNHKDAIEVELSPYPLVWQRLDDKVTCRIRTDRDNLQYSNQEDEDAICKFLTESSVAFLNVFGKFSKKIKK